MVERLQKRADFIACSKSPFVWKRPQFVLQCRLNNGCGFARVGFTVTKRQGNAVIRNRIKRRLREAVRLSLSPYLTDPNDYVFIGRASVADVPFETLCAEMVESVERLHHKIKKQARPSA